MFQVTEALSYACSIPSWMLPCSFRDDNELEPVIQPQLNVAFIRVALVLVSVHSTKALTKKLVYAGIWTLSF